MEVQIIPARKDNYMYLIIDKETRDAAVVDPYDADAVVRVAKERDVRLGKILTTHYHDDHSGGNCRLNAHYADKLQVFGGEQLPSLNVFVKDNDSIKVGNIDVRCIKTPCHTAGHVCYYATAPDGKTAVFTGDTLFQGGCGRFFEGTAEDMFEALYLKLGVLSNATKVYCGHEYTVQNLKFARHVEPQNQDVIKRLNWAEAQREIGTPTVPSTIGDEKTWNPFMRVHCAEVQEHVGETCHIKTMRKLRAEKDHFKC